jgi:hypothetical protein
LGIGGAVPGGNLAGTTSLAIGDMILDLGKMEMVIYKLGQIMF